MLNQAFVKREGSLESGLKKLSQIGGNGLSVVQSASSFLNANFGHDRSVHQSL